MGGGGGGGGGGRGEGGGGVMCVCVSLYQRWSTIDAAGSSIQHHEPDGHFLRIFVAKIELMCLPHL